MGTPPCTMAYGGKDADDTAAMRSSFSSFARKPVAIELTSPRLGKPTIATASFDLISP